MGPLQGLSVVVAAHLLLSFAVRMAMHAMVCCVVRVLGLGTFFSHFYTVKLTLLLLLLLQVHGISRSSLFIQTKFTPISGQDRSQPLPYDPAAPLPEQVRILRTACKVLSEVFTNYSGCQEGQMLLVASPLL
jgi:hypothetical protein